MELVLTRTICNDQCSIGVLTIDGVRECFTLEDVERLEKVYGKTAIPTGKYEVELTWSPRFNRVLPHVMNVPNFEGIRIHPGNTAEDTDGCILVGQSTNGKDTISSSRAAFNSLMDKMEQARMRGEKIWITVQDA